MILHFNLISVFLLCIGLMFWHALFAGTWFVALAVIVSAMLLMKRKKCLSAADIVFVTAFLLNLWYILFSWGNVRQYDYFNFFMHADYFVTHDFFINKPSDYLQSVYFQPPLWGAICGAVTKVMMLLGKTKEAGFDFVRFINLFAISGTGIIFWRMISLFIAKENVRFFGFALFLFLPINAIMANLVNNDAMVYFLMTATLYEAFLWYENGAWKQIYIMSGLLFLGAMIKFSALMIMPALGVLCLFKLINTKNKFSAKLWGQFVVLGLGAAIGFLWGFMLLYHHLPLTPPPINNDYQNMSSYAFFERMFSLEKIGIPFADLRGGQLEPNVWLTLVKTSLFGEWAWQGLLWAYLLYAIGMICAVLFIGSFFSLFNYKIGKDYAINFSLVVLVFSVFAAWINFWLEYPYFCSSEFRYVIILLPMAMLWFMNMLSAKKLPKTVDYALAVGITLLILARVMLYLHTI